MDYSVSHHLKSECREGFTFSWWHKPTMSLNRTISSKEWVSLSLRIGRFIWFGHWTSIYTISYRPKAKTTQFSASNWNCYWSNQSIRSAFENIVLWVCIDGVSLTGGVGDLIESPLTSRLMVVKLWPWLKKIGGGHAPNLYDREIVEVVKSIDVSWAASSTMGPSFKWLLH